MLFAYLVPLEGTPVFRRLSDRSVLSALCALWVCTHRRAEVDSELLNRKWRWI